MKSFLVLFLFLSNPVFSAANDGPLGDLPKKVKTLTGVLRSLKPNEKGGIQGSPSWSEWWKLMNFCVTNNRRVDHGKIESCFTQTFDSVRVSAYLDVCEGFRQMYYVFDNLYKGIMTPCEVAQDHFGDIKRFSEERLKRYNYERAASYQPFLDTYNKMAIAWINYFKQRHCIKCSEDGNTGIIQWGTSEEERFFFHIDHEKSYLIFPSAIGWQGPLHLVNFPYNNSSVENFRSFVCSKSEGIQSSPFLRIMRFTSSQVNSELAEVHRQRGINNPFGFKVVHGALSEIPYSSAAFFSGSPEARIGNFHDDSSPIYPFIQQILGERETLLLPLVDDTLDLLDVRALELEIAEILAQQNRVLEEDGATDTIETTSAHVRVVPDERVQKVDVYDIPQDASNPLPPESNSQHDAVPQTSARYPKRRSTLKLDSVCSSFQMSDDWSVYDERKKLHEMERQALQEEIARQVAKQHSENAARVQRAVESEQAKRGGGKKGSRQNAMPIPAPIRSSEPVVNENLERMTREAQEELNQRRIRMRDTARLMAAMINTMPENQIQRIAENVRGSHSVLQFDGGSPLTVVRPHGRSDLTMPGYRARSIVFHLRDILMGLGRVTGLTAGGLEN